MQTIRQRAVDPHAKLPVEVRWMIRRDFLEVQRIEAESFERPWTEEDFLCCLRERNSIGMVADRNGEIVGFMIYKLNKSDLHLVNFAVAANSRRMGVGSQMIQKMIGKLSQQRREYIVAYVRDGNLSAQLLFQSHGFRAVNVVRDYYRDSGEDAYVMEYSLRREQ